MGCKILAFDASGQTVSAAVVTKEKILCEIIRGVRQDHAETLLPTIADVLRRAETPLRDVDFIAVTSGPGSFTGLRIGAATAKGLAFFEKRTVVPVPTLTAVSYNIVTDDALIVPLADARRNQAYAAFYERRGGKNTLISDFLCEEIYDILARLTQTRRKIVFVGDCGVFGDAIKRSGLNYIISPAAFCQTRAGSVAQAAFDMLDDCGAECFGPDFEPLYIRKPQAEREFNGIL